MLMEALHRLGELAEAQGVQLEVCVYGGSAMILAFDRQSITKDVDALLEPAMLAKRLVKKVAEERDWDENWLNDDVRQFLAPKGVVRKLPLEVPGLRLFAPTAGYLLAMKALACREALPGYEGDIEDLRFLIRKMDIRSVDEVQEHIDKYYLSDAMTDRARAVIAAMIKEQAQP